MIDEVAVVQGRDELAWESADAAASAGQRADDKSYRATIRYQISLPRPIDCTTMSGASSATMRPLRSKLISNVESGTM